ncbi:Membrane-associated kinase regulator [Quillaja saponaria]|uniref:Membrane-associated kinase regulator n=1 Tax=Quillaja saponaria TaxID=32244 RepID=A0AAD7PWG7_QUISA|nr:Membrane-associated kinase regulator [Quillaja saponaria]
MCSETSSPRLSFSNDLCEAHVLPIKHDDSRRDTSLLGLNSEFEFSICRSREHQSSSADELFCNGVILPIQNINKRIVNRRPTHYCETPLPSLPPRPGSSSIDKMKKESIKEAMDVNCGCDRKSQSKSFWGFKRSKSLNCDTKMSSIFSLPILSRSNSTGSVPNTKRTSLKDAYHRHNSQKQPSVAKSSSSSFNLYPVLQKPPLNKSFGGSYGNGVRISPVLHVQPPCISKGTANFFGLGSFLRGGKEKKNKK